MSGKLSEPHLDQRSDNDDTQTNHTSSEASLEIKADTSSSNTLGGASALTATEATVQHMPLADTLQQCSLEHSDLRHCQSAAVSSSSPADGQSACQDRDSPSDQNSPSFDASNSESVHPGSSNQIQPASDKDESANNVEPVARGPRTPEPEEPDVSGVEIEYSNYENELQMPEIMQLIQKDLSEPYSIYTYRYFINNWPNLCFLARSAGRIIGAIVCKLDSHDSHTKRVITSRGYIAMLAVDERFRKRRIGSCLVLNAIRAMAAEAADEVVLETEVTNTGALRLYENLGFVRDKRLFRYYLNGVDALRLKLWLWPP